MPQPQDDDADRAAIIAELNLPADIVRDVVPTRTTAQLRDFLAAMRAELARYAAMGIEDAAGRPG